MITFDLDLEPAAMMWSIVAAVVVAVIAYFLGCLNGAVIVSKYILRDDVRTHGSGNAGLTNFYRAFGGPLTFAVILCDVLKAVFAVLLGAGLFGLVMNVPLLGKYWAGLFCLLGHIFPVTFGFKGGKGVLSGVTLMFCLDWRMGLIALGIFLVVVILTRYISLGSCLAAVSFPVSTWLFVSRDPIILVMSVALAGLVIFMHRGNLARVARREERKFSFHKKKD